MIRRTPPPTSPSLLKRVTLVITINLQRATKRTAERDANCKPLCIKGSRGALVKIRLSSHGYTLVAKAMKQADRQHQLQDAKVSSEHHSIQGRCTPVYLHKVHLDTVWIVSYEPLTALTGSFVLPWLLLIDNADDPDISTEKLLSGGPTSAIKKSACCSTAGLCDPSK
jgi:hypothetical protein